MGWFWCSWGFRVHEEQFDIILDLTTKINVCYGGAMGRPYGHELKLMGWSFESWVHVSMRAWVHVSMGAWVHESLSAWEHECMRAWVHESMSAWEHECMRACGDHVNIFEAFWISISSSRHHQDTISIAMLTAVILSALVAASGGGMHGAPIQWNPMRKLWNIIL